MLEQKLNGLEDINYRFTLRTREAIFVSSYSSSKKGYDILGLLGERQIIPTEEVLFIDRVWEPKEVLKDRVRAKLRAMRILESYGAKLTSDGTILNMPEEEGERKMMVDEIQFYADFETGCYSVTDNALTVIKFVWDGK